jgi:hypothetical protein
MSAKRFLLLVAPICLITLVMALAGIVRAENISPAHEQEFSDAKAAIEDSRNMRAEQLAPEPMKQAYELMETAANARKSKDAVLFSRASRLARTYAELAKAVTELRAEEGKLVAAKESLDRIKSDIEDLKKAP